MDEKPPFTLRYRLELVRLLEEKLASAPEPDSAIHYDYLIRELNRGVPLSDLQDDIRGFLTQAAQRLQTRIGVRHAWEVIEWSLQEELTYKLLLLMLDRYR